MSQFETDTRPYRRGVMSTSTFDLEDEVSRVSSVRFLETTAPVARAISRRQLAVEVGSNTPRFEFGVKFSIPGGYSVDPRHPAPGVHPSTPGPGHYEAVDPAATKMPNAPKMLWGDRGVWADVDHVELQKQKRDSYGRYMTAHGRRTLAEMSMSRAASRAMSRGALPERTTGAATSPFGVSRGASPASGLSGGERSDRSGIGGGFFGDGTSGGGSGMGSSTMLLPPGSPSRMSSRSGQLFTDSTQLATLNAASVIGGSEGASLSGLEAPSEGKKTEAKRRVPKKLVHPGETVYNLPVLNHGPPSVFAPTCSAYANRLFLESLTPSKRFVASPNTKHRPLSDFPNPMERQRYTRTNMPVRADTITETMRRKHRSIQFRVPDANSPEARKGPSKTYREVVLKPYRVAPVKRDPMPRKSLEVN